MRVKFSPWQREDNPPLVPVSVRRYFDQAVYVNAGYVNAVGVDFTRFYDTVLNFDHGDVSGHGHYGVEVALSQSELQVAKRIGAPGLMSAKSAGSGYSRT